MKDVNEINPYAFYLVDTLGVMYRHEMRKFFYLIDNNLSQNILMGFHSHNNLQMSFSNAQEMMRLNFRRTIIIDSSCYGMGRGVGNLATELLTDYINNNIGHRYYLTPILNIVDKYLISIYAAQRWGYDLPYFLSATVKCHPNYAAHLIRKETLSIEKIEKLLCLIPAPKRNEYDAELIEQLYRGMQACDVDDTNDLKILRDKIGRRDVLIVGAGSSIVTYKDVIEKAVEKHNLYVITINFISKIIDLDAFFVSNEKRISDMLGKIHNVGLGLITSNLKEDIKADVLVFDYASLLGEGELSDNAGAMLIRVLKRAGVKKIFLAGFDGFDVDSSINYFVTNYRKALDFNIVKKRNEDISRQLKMALNGVNYELLTPTKYEI